MRGERHAGSFAFLLLASLLALLVNGYHFAWDDQTLYIPRIDRALDSTLFPDDYLLDEPSGSYSLWLPAMTWLARHLPLEWLFFVGHLVTRFLLFWVVYRLTLERFGSRGAAIFAVLLLVHSLPVGGTRTGTQDDFFSLRSTAMPLAIAVLIPWFRGRLVPAAGLAAATCVVHPITAVPVFGLVVVGAVIAARCRRFGVATGALGALALGVTPLLVHVSRSGDGGALVAGLLDPCDTPWLDVLRYRNEYLFPSLWSAGHLALLVAPPAALLAIIRVRRRRPDASRVDRPAYHVVGVAAALFAIGWIFSEVWPWSIVLQLQVLRGAYPVVFLAAIYLAWVLWTATQRFARRRHRLAAVAAVVAVVVTVLVVVPGLRGDGHRFGDVELPGGRRDDPWVEVGRWARESTAHDAVFIVPVKLEGFRVHAQRAIAGDRKDGAPSMYSRRHALAWRERMRHLRGFEDLATDRLLELARRYGADFAVTRKGAAFDLPIAYENERFRVYRLGDG